MKSRNIKTRLAAFGLALLMGLSPLGNLADVHAAETKNPSEPVTESAEISETEQTEEVSEAAKHLVTAEDITKDISDKDFMAETCMEGIHYNPEKEDVTLERIEAEDGGSYHPDQEGTYIATYWSKYFVDEVAESTVRRCLMIHKIHEAEIDFTPVSYTHLLQSLRRLFIQTAKKISE